MSRFAFYLRTAANNLLRGGQRSVVAALCVMFGVMTLVAMTLLSQSIEEMLVLSPPEMIGGDLTLDQEAEDVISPASEAALQTLQEEGVIERFTLIAYSSALMLRAPGVEEAIMPATGMGVDPAVYPLAGALRLAENTSGGLDVLLAEPGSVIITKDLALEYDLQVGDPLVLADLRSGAPLAGAVRAIAVDTPNHQGSKVYYSLETAEQLAGWERAANTVLVNAPDSAAAKVRLEQSGWRVFTAEELAEIDRTVQQTFEFGLNGAGILGLLAGGVGITNTMQVLMRRRRREVAIWKTLGYRAGQLQALFALEAFLLGAAGSLVGAGLGVALSWALVDLFSLTTTLLVHWVFSPLHVAMGVAVGVFSTLLYAMLAIVTTSHVPPLALLRAEVLKRRPVAFLPAALLSVGLALPFLGMAALVMGSLWKGIAVVLAAVGALLVIGLCLGAITWLGAKLLPLRWWRLGPIVRRNLQRSGPSLVFAMTALFVGVVTISAGVVATLSARHVVDLLAAQGDQQNLAVYAPAGQAGMALQALEEEGAAVLHHQVHVGVARIRWNEGTDNVISPLLIGCVGEPLESLEGAPWGSQPDGIYVYSGLDIPAGSQLAVTLQDGSTHLLEVAGVYLPVGISNQPGRRLGVLLPAESLQKMAALDSVRIFAQVEPDRLDAVTAALSARLSEATVINLAAFATRFIEDIRSLFVFIAAVAGLGILAGLLLMANSVSIAMLDRRYEIGMLKVLGYSHGQVLGMLVVEYTLVSTLVSVLALGLVQAGVMLVGFALNANSGVSAPVLPPLVGLLSLSFSSAASIALAAIALTLATAAAVTWRPARSSPALVINHRE